MNKSIKKASIFFSNLLSFIITTIYGTDKFVDVNNGLLIINTEKLGDLILSADFLTSLRNDNKYDRYDLLISESYINLFDWKELKYNPITINKKIYRYNIKYRLQIISKIRRKRYSHVINITQERGMINDELAILSGANKKTAMKDNSRYLPKVFLERNNNHYTEILKAPVENEYERLSYYLAINGIKGAYNNKIFGKDDIHIESIDRRLNKKSYIVIAPMSSEMDKSWGIENYKILCLLLSDDIVLVGTREEQEVLESITRTRENIWNLGGQLSFSEISILLKNCLLYVGNDSGLTHLAHQLKTPLFGIIKGESYGKFFPYKEREDAIFQQNKFDLTPRRAAENIILLKAGIA